MCTLFIGSKLKIELQCTNSQCNTDKISQQTLTFLSGVVGGSTSYIDVLGMISSTLNLLTIFDSRTG